MNITIFGGTGPSGLLSIEKALQKGHHVTAYARAPEKITIVHDNLTKVKGELMERNKIEIAIVGADAVICLLGPKTTFKQLSISNAYAIIIAAMHKYRVRRLVAAVSSSYSDPNDTFQFMVSLGVVTLRILAPSILKDIRGFGNLIRHSNLDWTMVRLPILKNIPARGLLHIGYAGDGKFNFFELSRADLAHFLVAQLESTQYLHKAPAISSRIYP
jgi:putative NADH-flavin reductase